MAAGRERVRGEQRVEIDGAGMVARQPPDDMRGDPLPGRIEHVQPQRQRALCRRHRRRQHDGAEAPARQHRERQQEAAPEPGRQGGDHRVGREIRALDIDMGDVRPAFAHHLVARPHHVLPGPELDLRRPGETGQQRGAIDRDRSEGSDRVRPGRRRLRAHAPERHGAGRDRHGVAVLQPEHDPLVRPGRRQAGVERGGPGVGVVGAGEAGAGANARADVGVEGVFHHVVPGRADGVEKELAGEGRQAEAAADRGAVDDDPGPIAGDRLLPRRQNTAVGVEQAQPEPDRPGAIAGPVIGGDEAGREPAGIAEEGEVGGEIEPVEIARRVGQHRRGQPRRIQRRQLGARRQQGRQTRGEARGIEGGDEHARRARRRQFGERAGDAAGPRQSDRAHVLHEDIGERRQARRQRGQRRRDAVHVHHRDRPARGQARRQRRQRLGGQRMGERLVEHVAALLLVERLDRQHHAPLRCRTAGAARALPPGYHRSPQPARDRAVR